MKKLLIIFTVICINLSITSFAETVIYNPNSGIYHNLSCPHGARCKSCIKIDKQKAKQQGGRPCKTCGG